MEPGNTRLVARLRAKRVTILASGLMLAATQASAHIMPWREGVSRQTGFGTCAKGPCLKRTDFSPSVPHVHLAVNGRDGVAICTGLQRKPIACLRNAAHQ
jgi:hypothetical protein